MFEVGFSELLLIMGLALLVLGPEKLPKVVTEIGRWMGRARAMARQFKDQLEIEAAESSRRKSTPGQNTTSPNATSPNTSQDIEPSTEPNTEPSTDAQTATTEANDTDIANDGLTQTNPPTEPTPDSVEPARSADLAAPDSRKTDERRAP
jgi:sec-independent protein translocase protein TatB